MKKQIIFNGIRYLDEALKDAKKVLLVCDSSFTYLNIKDDIENMGVPHVVFSDFTPNPLYEDVCKGVDLFNSTKCDVVLAVGGGSSLDVAKCIKLYCKMPKDKLFLDQAYRDTGVKLIAIPTTAGTGSESTRYAVIYYEGKKQSVTHDSIIPDIAILEPMVLKTLPLYQKKCTMLDALCQGIESWWSVNSTDESKLLSKQAVVTIMQWWHEYIFGQTDEAAEAIMHAANLAGQAICITQTTAPHACSYKLTSLYGLPHGHAVAVCLPVIWKFMLNHIDRCIDYRGQEYLFKIFKDISATMSCDSPENAIFFFNNLMRLMDISKPVSSCKEVDVECLKNAVNPIRLKNNPVGLDSDCIMLIYNEIVEERDT